VTKFRKGWATILNCVFFKMLIAIGTVEGKRASRTMQLFESRNC